MADIITGDVILKVRKDQILLAAHKVREHCESEFNKTFPDEAIVNAISKWLEIHLDHLSEDLPERLTTPSKTEAHEFRLYLDEFVQSIPVFDEERAELPAADVFTGNRLYSLEKFAAMTAYIASRGHKIYKTKLNKLLFYSDFINFYLHGSSISGARYAHLPNGPVPESYESILTEIARKGDIQIIRGQGFEEITASAYLPSESLSPNEIATIDWVLENLGSMSAVEISEFSHREKAYRFTRQGENIAYEYAKFFQKLPDSRLPR